ncbi:hypothetical protein O7623_22195 [Solwaraspora sp. WMMD791]|uniref:hypothetical protein n=1 Tax=Solwaraspora sp. WMMD791 TaxID=3016086 RepID=UPI00249BEA72|nr:hypothetical protein [Solwaraspora sp. WMMD791]WFE26051.1 hypothetical protein O7623_22195 [Solwaraspora sp. WMMD791]
MPYTPDKPLLPRSSDELRTDIPGWGVDLDPRNRPSVPKERFDPDLNGAHWRFPERQTERWPRERSIEHRFLTPVFGTSCPPRGLSGKIRRYSYGKYSEARAAHWLLLIAADRIDTVESALRSSLTNRANRSIIAVAPWVLALGIGYAVGSCFVNGRAGSTMPLATSRSGSRMRLRRRR